MKKALAVIRSDSLRGCPFGLSPVSFVCKNAGKSVLQMQPLEDVPLEQREKYAKANRRVYRHEQEDQRCVFADSILEGRDDMVNCDQSEGASAGEHEQAFTGSPFYPRVFQGINDSMYVYPLANYTGYGVNQLFDGLFSMYSSTGEIKIQKISNPASSANLTTLYYEFENAFLGPGPDQGHSEDKNGNH